MSKDHNNFGLWLRRGLDHWHLFALILPAALVFAYLYLQYTPPKYKVDAMLLIKDDEGQLNEEIIFSELGLSKKSKNLENEVLILRSTPLMHEVVSDLELQYQYTEIDNFQNRELYKNSPVKVLQWIPAEQGKALEVVLYPEPSGEFRLELEEGEYTGEYGRELIMPEGKLTLLRDSDHEIENPIEIRLSSIWDRAKELGEKIEVEVKGESSSVLHLAIKDHTPERAKDVLTRLLEVYNERTVKKKNSIFENSIQFIDDRIKLIAGELSATESDVEDYKRNHNVVELSTEGNMILAELSNFNKQISDSEVQLEILNTIQYYLTKNSKQFEFVPTNLTLTNLTLSKQLDQFNELLTTMQRMKSELGAAHPELLLTEKQLENLRNTIINNLHSMRKDLQIASRANTELKGNLERRLQSLPKRERELVEIERKKDIKENLYIYLLQKREEAAISLSLTAATGQIVEPPSYSDPVNPKHAQVWLVSVFLGFAIPAGFIIMLTSMDDKIREEDEINELTDVPLLGVLANTRRKEKVVAGADSISTAAEMFRLLRSNITHGSLVGNPRSLLITSSIYGEGKSYIAINLALTQVQMGKRVLVIDLDLRNKTPEKYGLEASPRLGIADYLTDPDIMPGHIILNSDLHQCLDVIHRGALIPNANQMILSKRLRQLMDQLKDEYDHIILDAPPVGLVSDPLEMSDLADATMFVVRAGVTRKDHLQIVENIRRMNKMPNPFIVLNGLKMNSPINFARGLKATILPAVRNRNGIQITTPQSTLGL